MAWTGQAAPCPHLSRASSLGQMGDFRQEGATESEAADCDLVRVVQADRSGYGSGNNAKAGGKAQDIQGAQDPLVVDHDNPHANTLNLQGASLG